MGLLGLLLALPSQAQPVVRGAEDEAAPEDEGLVEDPLVEDLDEMDVGAPDPDDLGAIGIVDGQNVTEPKDEVVALGFQSGGFVDVFCSGSLIHPNWVLTAAHCIVPASQGPPGSSQVVMWGNQDGDGWTETIEWARAVVSPRYQDSGDIRYDIALVELAVAKADPVIMVLNDAPIDTSWVGTPRGDLTFYGFGATGDDRAGAGTKRTTVLTMDGVDESDISTRSDGITNVCYGDSGGPSTYMGPDGPEQVGVSSTVDGNPPCEGGNAESARVDVHIDWMLEHVPRLVLEYEDLPSEDVDDGRPSEDVRVTRRWDDLGIDEVNGINGEWINRSPVERGCSTAPGPAAGWALAGLLPLLLLRRRWHDARR